MNLIRFIAELIRAAFHACREAYYRVALNHIGHTHEDSQLVTVRLMHSQRIVNDFIGRAVR